MRGKVTQWNDDKGFGFIQPDDGSKAVFFHVSDVETNARRPQLGDSVAYLPSRDSRQRLKAKNVAIEGVPRASRSPSRRNPVRTTPPKKDALDYILILVALFSIAAAGHEFYLSDDIAGSVPFAVPAVIAFLLLMRQKKPKEKSFQCAGCRKVAEHDVRTIKAWNKGVTRLFCRSCHFQWLQDNPRPDHAPHNRQGGGCLGVLALMALIPTLAGVAIYLSLV